MRPEVSDPIVQRFRGSEVQFGHTVRTYIRQPTDMRPDSDLPFECAQQWAQTSRPSASASALPSFPVFVLRVFIFIFIFNFIHLGLVCLLGCAGCFAMKSEVQETDWGSFGIQSVVCTCRLMTEIADRGSWIGRTAGMRSPARTRVLLLLYWQRACVPGER